MYSHMENLLRANLAKAKVDGLRKERGFLKVAKGTTRLKDVNRQDTAGRHNNPMLEGSVNLQYQFM